MVKKILKWTGIVLGSIILLLTIAIAVVLNFIFTPEKLTPMVEEVAQEYIATDIDIKGVELTFFSTFPDFSVKIDTLVITQLNDSIEPLLYTQQCYASINPMALLDNELIVNGVTLEGANIHLYVDSLIGPLKVFKLPTDTTAADTTQSEAYDISLDQIKILSSNITIDDRTKDFYTKLEDMSLDLSATLFPGLIDFDMLLNLPGVTISHEGESLANNESLVVDANMNFVRDSLKLTITQADLKVNTIDLKSNGTLSVDSTKEKLFVDLYTTLSTPSISEFLRLIPATLIDNKETLTTDGVVDLAVEFKGEYSQSSKPLITAHVEIENAKAKYQNRKVSIDEIDCNANLFIDLNEPRNSQATISNFKFSSSQIIDLDLSGRVTNMILDPFMDLDIKADIDFGRLTEIFPLQEGIELEGKSQSNLTTQMALSDITSSNYGKFYINGESTFNNLVVAIDGATYTGDSTSTGSLYIDIEQSKVLFGDNVRDDNSSRTLLSTINLTGLAMQDKEGQFIVINNLNMTAGANFDTKTQSVNGLGVALDVQDLNMGIEEELDLIMTSSAAKFTITPENEVRKTKITGEMSSDSLLLYEYANNSEANLSKSSVQFELLKQGEKQWDRQGTVSFTDFNLVSDLFPLDVSLTRSNVEVDNNNIKLNNTRIQIGESSLMATGNVTNLFTTLFMQGQRQQGQQGQGQGQNQQKGQQQKDQPQKGQPQGDLQAQTKTNIEGKLTIRSRSLNLTELIDAVNQSVLLSDSTFTEEEDPEVVQNVIAQNNRPKNDNPQKAQNSQKGQNNRDQRRVGNPDRDSTIRENRSRREANNNRRMPQQVENSMMLVPKNINFDMNLNLSKVLYEGGSIDSVVGNAKIAEGVVTLEKLSLRAIGAQAHSSMVYQNINRNDSKLFLEMDLTDVDINRIGELLPTIDTLMPMIKSFEGSVDLDLRALGIINSRRGFNPEKVKAAMNMKGRDLVLMDSETFTDLSKLLMFKNKDRNLIDSLELNITADSARVDVLPFNIAIDRYTAIVGGTQVIDSSYNIIFDYNVSILKSPLPFKAGVDITGDLNDYDYDITRAKLKNTDFVEQEKQFKEFMESIQ